MRHRGFSIAFVALLLAVLTLLGFSAGAGQPDSAGADRPDLAGRLAAYAYGDTKDLVVLVEDAAGLMEQKGTAAFAEFADGSSRWNGPEGGLFVYSLDGTCLFEATEPDLVGRHLMGLKDIDGKPVVQMITDIAADPAPDASGWVFYLWENSTEIVPHWKSSYVRKVIAPDHKVYLVGGSLLDGRIEKAFVKERIKAASRLFQREGKVSAFATLRDAASPFVFLDTYIFVLDSEGHALVDPGYPNMVGRDITSFKDAVGFEPVRELLKRMKQADTGAVQFISLRPDTGDLVRRLLYARKIVVGGETLILAADFELGTPIWMKVENALPCPANPLA
jgi:signal transduction histidine kinase